MFSFSERLQCLDHCTQIGGVICIRTDSPSLFHFITVCCFWFTIKKLQPQSQGLRTGQKTNSAFQLQHVPFIETQLIIQILIKWERWEEWVNHSTSGFIRSTECWIQCAHGFLYHKHKLRRQREHLDQTVQMKDSWHLNPRDSPAAHRETMQPHKKKEGQLVKWQQANGQRRNRGYTKRLRKKWPQEFRCCDTINLLSVSKMLN